MEGLFNDLLSSRWGPSCLKRKTDGLGWVSKGCSRPHGYQRQEGEGRNELNNEPSKRHKSIEDEKLKTRCFSAQKMWNISIFSLKIDVKVIWLLLKLPSWVESRNLNLGEDGIKEDDTCVFLLSYCRLFETNFTPSRRS